MSPSTWTSWQTVTPIRFGRPLARWAKTPTLGQPGLPRVPGGGLHLVGADPVEDVDDLDMGELLEALESLRREPRGVERDGRGDIAPAVVDGLGTRRS